MALQPITSTKNDAAHNGAHAVQPIPVILNGRTLEPNRRMALNLDWVDQVRVNTSAVERRAATQVARRTVKKDTQAAWLLRAIACMDLTTLSGDDSVERVRRLCAKARNPLQRHIVEGLGIADLHLTVGAVCVYHAFVETAVKALEGSGIPVAAVSAGFPAGLSPLAERVAEIHRSVEAGAQEIDIVITRAHVFNGEWQALYDEVAAFQRGVRAQRAHEGDSRHRRPDDAAQRGAGQLGGDDGWGRFHQDFDGQGKRERDAAGFAGDGAMHPRLCRADGHGRGIQAGGRHSHGQAVDWTGWP